MAVRAPRMVIVLGAFLAGLALCFGVLLLVARRVEPLGQAATIGGPFRLVDQNGKVFTEKDMQGKPYLVFFGFTHCPDVCPTTLMDMSAVFRDLGTDADKLGALFITIDPERDKPDDLKIYLSNFDPHLRGLTGDPGAIASVAKAYRVYYKKVPLEGGDYTMDHTALVYLMNKRGHFVAPFNLKRKSETAAADLRHYL